MGGHFCYSFNRACGTQNYTDLFTVNFFKQIFKKRFKFE